MKNAVRMHPLVYIEPFVALLIIANGIMILGLTCVFTSVLWLCFTGCVTDSCDGFLGLSRCITQPRAAWNAEFMVALMTVLILIQALSIRYRYVVQKFDDGELV